MKFGTLYSYWDTEWDCDYAKYVEIAKKVAEIGFDVLEISADHIYEMPESELKQLDEVAKELGLILTANSGPSREHDFASADSTVRKNGIEYFITILEKMTIINSDTLIGAIYSFWPADFVDTDKKTAWYRSIECLKEVGKKAEELGIQIGLEVLNRNETYILTDCKEAIEYCNQIGSPNVNILLDTYHMNIEEDNMADAIRLAGDRLIELHVGENNRKLPGMNNTVDWASVGKALNDIDFKRTIVMEPFLLSGGSVGGSIRVWRDLSNGADRAQMDKNIEESLKFLRKTFAS